METIPLNSLTLGEVGEKNVEIIDSIISMTCDLSSELVPEIQFSVQDDNFRMQNSNYFMVGRRAVFNDDSYEIAAITVSHGVTDVVNVTARLQVVQQLRREKGPANYGSVSPSAYVASVASRLGLEFFGEESAVNGNIQRVSNENEEESTLDVIRRLASELDFRFFIAKGTMFFASDSFIASRQPSVTVNIPSKDDDLLYVSRATLRQSSDSKKSTQAQVSFIKNTTSQNLFPGATLRFTGVQHFTGVFIIDKVKFDMDIGGTVDVSATDVTDYEQLSCTLREYSEGSSGECVKRIQVAVGTIIDGDFGPVTARAVRNFQESVGLPTTGVVDSLTWSAIVG